MKKAYALFIGCLFAHTVFSQTASFSTIRQAFNFAAGDSFEYINTNGFQIQGTPDIYNTTFYGLFIVKSVSIMGDSIQYTYSYVEQAGPDNPSCLPGSPYECGGGSPPFPSQAGDCYFLNQSVTSSSDSTFTIYALDSLTSFMWGPCTDSAGCMESVFNDSIYSFHEQNQFSNNSFSDQDATFADSLGMVNMYWWNESGWSSYQEQLIWYHKANGGQWGNYLRITPTSVNIINEPSLAVNIFPNPSNGNFSLNLTGTRIDDTRLKIFDASGRMLYQKKIYENLTGINLRMFNNGLYLWRVEEGNSIIARGKLILE